MTKMTVRSTRMDLLELAILEDLEEECGEEEVNGKCRNISQVINCQVVGKRYRKVNEYSKVNGQNNVRRV